MTIHRRLTLLGIPLLALLVASINAAAAPAAPATGQSAAKEDADPAFDPLQKEYLAASRAWQAEVKKAKDAKIPESKWPVHPVKDFWPRFEALANADNPRAVGWCLDYVDELGLDAKATNGRRLGYYRRLIEKFPDADATRDAVRGLVTDSSSKRLGIDPAADLCAEAAKRTTRDDIRRTALFNQAQICASAEGDEGKLARARELYGEIAVRFPGTEIAARAKGKLFALDNLQVGKTVPDFTATDVDGVGFKLSDYRGKVVVLDFWGFW